MFRCKKRYGFCCAVFLFAGQSAILPYKSKLNLKPILYLDRTLSLCYDETTPPQGGVCEVYAMKQKFDVTGMTCSACSAHVEKAVCKLEGVRTVQVNLLDRKSVV